MTALECLDNSKPSNLGKQIYPFPAFGSEVLFAAFGRLTKNDCIDVGQPKYISNNAAVLFIKEQRYNHFLAYKIFDELSHKETTVIADNIHFLRGVDLGLNDDNKKLYLNWLDKVADVCCRYKGLTCFYQPKLTDYYELVA